MTTNPLRRAAALLSLLRLLGFMICSPGCLRRLVEIDFDTKHPIVMDARYTSVKLFLRHTHLTNQHQGIDALLSTA